MARVIRVPELANPVLRVRAGILPRGAIIVLSPQQLAHACLPAILVVEVEPVAVVLVDELALAAEAGVSGLEIFPRASEHEAAAAGAPALDRDLLCVPLSAFDTDATGACQDVESRASDGKRWEGKEQEIDNAHRWFV